MGVGALVEDPIRQPRSRSSRPLLLSTCGHAAGARESIKQELRDRGLFGTGWG